MKRLTNKTKKQIEIDFIFFIMAVSLLMFACVGFEKQIEKPNAVLPAPVVNTTENTEEEIEEYEEIILSDLCKGLYGTQKKICLAIYENNFSICENQECLIEFAKNKSSEDACNQIETESYKYYCLSIIKGTEQCLLAKSENGKNKCLADYANYTGEENLCTKITEENGEFKKQCYLSIAIKELNCTKCKFNTLGESALKDECRRDYAKITGDTSCCSDLWSKSWENDCYRQAAFDNGKAYLCNDIENNYHRWQCYQGVFNTGNPKEIEECKKISNEEWIGKCITNLAVLQNNSNLCTEITTEQEKRNCQIKFE